MQYAGLTKTSGPSGPSAMIDNSSRRYTQCHLNVTPFLFWPCSLGHGRLPKLGKNIHVRYLVETNLFLQDLPTVSRPVPYQSQQKIPIDFKGLGSTKLMMDKL